jgi:hypothetical protein
MEENNQIENNDEIVEKEKKNDNKYFFGVWITKEQHDFIKKHPELRFSVLFRNNIDNLMKSEKEHDGLINYGDSK